MNPRLTAAAMAAMIALAGPAAAGERMVNVPRSDRPAILLNGPCWTPEGYADVKRGLAAAGYRVDWHGGWNSEIWRRGDNYKLFIRRPADGAACLTMETLNDVAVITGQAI